LKLKLDESPAKYRWFSDLQGIVLDIGPFNGKNHPEKDKILGLYLIKPLEAVIAWGDKVKLCPVFEC